MKKYNELELIGKLRADFQEEMETTTKATELLPNFVSKEYIDWLEAREVKKLHMQSVTVPIGKGCDSPCCRNLATHTVITPNEYYCDEHNSL